MVEAAYALNGPTVRLTPARDASLARGPGQLGRDGVPGAVLFHAGGGIVGLDLFAAFWREEALAMDWLVDFLCDPEMDALIAVLSNPAEEEDEEEILYSKRQLTTLGSEVMDEY